MRNKLFSREYWGMHIVRLNQSLEKPIAKLGAIALMILIVFVYFAYSNLQFQKTNEILLQNTNNSARNTERIIQDLELAVAELKADNAQQTVILCRLILGSNVTDISDGEKAEIEDICNAQINQNGSRQGTGETSGGTATSNQAPSVQTEGRGQLEPDDADPPEESDPPQTPPNEPPGLVNNTVDFVQSTVRSIVNGIKGLF